MCIRGVYVVYTWCIRGVVGHVLAIIVYVSSSIIAIITQGEGKGKGRGGAHHRVSTGSIRTWHATVNIIMVHVSSSPSRVLHSVALNLPTRPFCSISRAL